MAACKHIIEIGLSYSERKKEENPVCLKTIR
jgi:hypothetical protein